MIKLIQAGIWILIAAAVLGGVGLSGTAGLSTLEFLSGDHGYYNLSGAEEVMYGIFFAGLGLLVLAGTIGVAAALYVLLRYVGTYDRIEWE